MLVRVRRYVGLRYVPITYVRYAYFSVRWSH